MVYTTFLGSFLTKSIDKVTFPIICPQNRLALLGNLDYKKFNFIVTDFTEYKKLFTSLNLEFGYCISSTLWKDYIRPTYRKAFRVIVPWKSTYGHFLRINKNSKHLRAFNEYVLKVYSHGFNVKWRSEMNLMALNDSLKRQKVQSFLKTDGSILTFKDFYFPFVMLDCGFGIAFCAFVLEFFVWKYFNGKW